MLKRLAALIRKPKDPVPLSDVPTSEGRPAVFAKALLERSALEQRIVEADHVAKGLPPLPEFPKTTLAEELQGATFFVAHHLATEAAKRIGRRPHLLNLEPLDGKDLALVAFVILVAQGIVGRLRRDDVVVDFSAVVGSILRVTFLAYSYEDRLKHGETCLDIYRSMATATEPNVEDWRRSLYDIACLYITQSTSSSTEVREMDIIELLGSQLRAMLDAVEE